MSKQLRWKVHAPNLLVEVLNNPSTGILSTPLTILSRILAEIAERASQINDPIMNELMCRLTLYEVADPASDEFNPEMLEVVFALAEKARKGGE